MSRGFSLSVSQTVGIMYAPTGPTLVASAYHTCYAGQIDRVRIPEWTKKSFVAGFYVAHYSASEENK